MIRHSLREPIPFTVQNTRQAKCPYPKKRANSNSFTYPITEGQAALSGPKKVSVGRKSEFQPLLKHIKELKPGESMLLHNIPANQVKVPSRVLVRAMGYGEGGIQRFESRTA